MPNRHQPEKSNRDPPVDRRLQLRRNVDSMDWETKVLKRVERHVESLSGSPASQSGRLSGFGWEESSLLVLRRRFEAVDTE